MEVSSQKPGAVPLITGMLAVMVIFLASWSGVGALYAVEIGGLTLGVVEDEVQAREVLALLAADVGSRLGKTVEPAEELLIKPLSPGGEEEPASPEELKDRLREAVTWLAEGYVISVNGKEVVALSDRAAAEGVIDDIIRTYRGGDSGQGERVIQEVRVLEKVEIKQKKVPAELFRTPQEARQILMRGTDKMVVHTVQRGESLWSIARANRMSTAELQRANPDLADPDRLQVGQSISLVVADPYLNVTTTEKVTTRQNIPYPVKTVKDDTLWPWQRVTRQAGEPGLKLVVMEVTRKNGVLTGQRVLSEQVLKEPVAQVVAQGSRVVSGGGTGKLLWPLSGQITSGYGWRATGRYREFHNGLDIAAPAGTPILAADSGVVVFAGWNGGYGLTLVIDHGGGLSTLYGHNSTNLVKVGSRVDKGQVIARVGSTGRSTGPHLHFEVRVNGEPVNPTRYYR